MINKIFSKSYYHSLFSLSSARVGTSRRFTPLCCNSRHQCQEFIVLVYPLMGHSSCLFVEAKVFDISLEEGLTVLHITKRSRAISRAVFLRKVNMEWLSATMEVLIQGEGQREFVKSLRVGSRVFITHTGSKSHGRFLTLAE